MTENSAYTPDDPYRAGFQAGFTQGFGAGFENGFDRGFQAGQSQAHYDSRRARKEEKRAEKLRRREEKAAASAGPAPAPAPRKPKRKAHGATVTGKRQISPDMVRLTISAPDLVGQDLDKTDHYIKILFVPEGADYAWPFDLAEARANQPRHLRPVTRTYTLRSVNTDTGECEVDFVLHGDAGLAGPWARDVEVGEEFGFAGPGGKFKPEPGYDTFVLAGDEAAAPAVAAALEKLPPGAQATAFVEVEAPGHEIEMPQRPNATIQWVYRNGATPGAPLAAAVRKNGIPAGHTCWFIHGVAEMIKDLRRFLFKENGVDKADASISGYWRLGMTEDLWQSTKGEFVAAMEAEEKGAAD